MNIQSTRESLFNRLPISIILKRTMLLSKTLFFVLSNAHKSLQQGISTQMSSASYKKIEVDYDSWTEASLDEAKTFFTDNRRRYDAEGANFVRKTLVEPADFTNLFITKFADDTS